MSPPRAPQTREPLDIAVEFLRGQDGEGLREVADLLEDIADGRWTLVNEEARLAGCFCQAGRGVVCPGCRVQGGGQVRAVTPLGPRPPASRH